MADEYRLENRAIDTYFQKSYKFLYPLLNITNKNIRPIQTFISWKDRYQPNDCRLICVYELDHVLKLNDNKTSYISEVNQSTYQQFERMILFKNEYYETFLECEDNKGAYVFNLSKFREDWMHFCNGQYSLFSTAAKGIVLRFYATNKYSTEYMTSYLHPNKYFKTYSDLINVDESLLVEVGELCNPYDKDKETFKMETVDTPFINKSNAL